MADLGPNQLLEPAPEPEPEPETRPSTNFLTSIETRLGKKRTFVPAVQELREYICSNYEGLRGAQQSQCFLLVRRVVTLLRSRYTSPRFWRAGCELFLSCVCFMDGAGQQSSLQEWVIESERQLQEGELKEIRAEAARRAAASRKQTQSAPNVPVANSAFDVQRQLSEFLAEAGLDPGAVMDHVFQAESAGPPPASRNARANLRLVTIGCAGQLCAVCQEQIPHKAKAKQMPCKHVFHDKCVLEWLERHHSCPVCRYTLPSEKQSFDLDIDEISRRDATESRMYA